MRAVNANIISAVSRQFLHADIACFSLMPGKHDRIRRDFCFSDPKATYQRRGKRWSACIDGQIV